MGGHVIEDKPRFSEVWEQLLEIRVLGTCSTMEKWVEGKLNKAFLNFLPNSCHI